LDIAARFADYDVVLRPDRDEAEWWAGAPSVARGKDGTFYLAGRMREGQSQRSRRGYEVRLLASADGVRFEPVASIGREGLPIHGFERPAIVRDPATGRFRLYLCGQWEGGPWAILRLDDADDPARFDASTCRPVLRPGPDTAGATSLKDPFIRHVGGCWHMLVIGLLDDRERAFHFVSDDGDAWSPVGDGPAFELAGWHDFFTRPACLVPMAAGWLMVYEGSNAAWHDPVYNIATGLAWTHDLRTFTDLTPDAPLLTSPTPGTYRTWRYSHWLWVGDELWAYAEVACPNDTNEVRLFRLPRE
jgi:hypothetical protein